MVLDMVNKFRCRNSGRGIYKLASFTLAHSTFKVMPEFSSEGRIFSKGGLYFGEKS